MKNRELVVAKIKAIGEQLIKNAELCVESNPDIYKKIESIDIQITLTDEYDGVNVINYKEDGK